MTSRKGPIRVLHFGLGPIGAAIVRQVASRTGFKMVGGVDIDPAKVGRDLGEIAGVGRSLRVRVSDDPRKAIKATKPDVVVLCTQSSLKKVMPQMEAILKHRVPIVSTTEELAYPCGANLRYARALHRLAKKAKVAVLGTGVNPGFTMDALADHADRRLRAGGRDARRSDPGCPCAPAAVPAEDRRRPDARAVHAQGGRRERAARRAGRVDLDDRRCDGLEARQDHRRHRAEDRDRDGGERVPRRRCRLRLRDRAGRHRLSQGHAGHHAAHGGLPRRAGVVRCRRDHRVAGAEDED